MNNLGALISTAMLTTYLEKDHKCYQDLLLPYITNIMPREEKARINLEVTKQRMAEEYGFEGIPLKVVETLIKRCMKAYPGSILRDTKGYYIANPLDTTHFEENHAAIKSSIDSILEAMRQYFRDEYGQKLITIDEAENRLSAFLGQYGFTTHRNLKSLMEVTKNSGKDNYMIAQFILEAHRKQSKVIDQLDMVIRGYFIYKALYHYATDCGAVPSMNLRSTQFYFDTGLIKEALGYSRDDEKESIREIVRLVKRYGGEACTFEHNKDEVIGLLVKYDRDPANRNSLGLDKLVSANITSIDVQRMIAGMTDSIEGLGVRIKELPEYGIIDSEKARELAIIDPNSIRATLKQVGEKHHWEYSDRSTDNDAEAISAINRIRRKSKACSIENCKAILVTRNKVVLESTESLMDNEKRLKEEIKFAIDDDILAALLWQKNPEKSKLPMVKLLEYAYSACKPTKALIEAFHRKIDSMKSMGEITDKEALLMRTEYYFRNKLVEETNNDPNLVNTTTLTKMRDEYITEIGEKAIKVAEEDKRELNAFKEKKSDALKDAYQRKQRIERIIETPLTIVFTIVALVITVLIAYKGSEALFDDPKMSMIIALIIVLIVIIESVIPRFMFCKKLSKKVALAISDMVYTADIEKLRKLYPEDEF